MKLTTCFLLVERVDSSRILEVFQDTSCPVPDRRLP